MIEALESRVAPAILVNPTTVTYRDFDGDNVTVKVTKPIFTEDNVADILNFSNTFGNQGPQLLLNIDLVGLSATANGIGITVTAKRSSTTGGNGSVFIDSINGSNIDPDTGLGAGLDLGKVSIQGGIGSIGAGDPDEDTPALTSLKVHFLGFVTLNSVSDIYGNVGSISVRGNLGGVLHVNGGDLSAPGISKLTIGGSLLPANGTVGGRVDAFRGFGTVVIKGGIIGGSADSSGLIVSANAAKSITVGGSLIGGDGERSGAISVSRIENLKVGGSLVGDDGFQSGTIRAYSTGITTGLIGGDIVGGSGPFSGRVMAGSNTGFPGNIGNLAVKGSITGFVVSNGAEAEGAGIYANGSIEKLTIFGNVNRANIIAGVAPGADGRFGDAVDEDDTTGGASTISTLSKLVIKGTIAGSFSVTDFYGIEANKIISVQIGSAKYKDTDPTLNFATGVQLSFSEDVLLREVN